MASAEYDPEAVFQQALQISRSALDPEERRVAFPEFVERFPMLFDMCCRGNLDQTMLRSLLDVQAKVSAGKLTSDGADQIVGVGLGNRYVVPVLSSLPTPPPPSPS